MRVCVCVCGKRIGEVIFVLTWLQVWIMDHIYS